MNALLMHVGDTGLGGAQVQMHRLRAGLRERGVDARILCRTRTLEDSVQMPSSPRVERWIRKVSRRAGLNDLELLSSFRLDRLDEFKQADVIDFHCLHSGAFSYLALPRVTASKPAVFTFHDMWPLTGHCHASLECDRWKTGCGRCPHPEVYPPVSRDMTSVEWRLKRWAYGRSKFIIVTPSRWLFDRTRESMLSDFTVRHVPHGIDTSVYRPLDKERCRELLGIPKGKKVLLFAVERMDRPLKGADLLVAALKRIPDRLKRESVLLLIGHSGGPMARMVDMPAIDLGFLSSDPLKVLAFSAADLFVHPTRADVFSLVILESMACGTPAVSFRVGAVPELVRPGLTGLLAEPENPNDLAARITELLENPSSRERMGTEGRKVAIEEYPIGLQAQRYHEIYREALEERTATAEASTAPVALVSGT